MRSFVRLGCYNGGMRRAFLMLALVVVLSAQTVQDDFTLKVINFERHWGKVILDLTGCRPEAALHYDPALCDANRRTLNYAEYGKARKAAIRLFALTEEELRDGRK